MNRVAFVAVLGGAMFVAAAFFALSNRSPDAAGDGGARESAPAPDIPPAPASATPRTEGPPPPAPPPPRAPRPPRPAPAEDPAAEPAAPATATLRVASDVPGAQVFLNREFVGAAPATAANLAPGAYQLNVSAPGYESHVETVTLAPGEREITVNFREVRLNASLAVVHKHRFGSCRGTLVASGDAIRYDTADEDDRFRASLLELATFEVDYLDKNLRIQPRTGRRYDFTDPDGDADRLFVFHREVDRARERLKAGDRPSGQ